MMSTNKFAPAQLVAVRKAAEALRREKDMQRGTHQGSEQSFTFPGEYRSVKNKLAYKRRKAQKLARRRNRK